MNDTRMARHQRPKNEANDGARASGDATPDSGATGVVCGHCQQAMSTAASCVPGTLVIAGRRFARRPEAARRSGAAPGAVARCAGCGVLDGGIHHLGCDLERCPRCRRQLVSCGCLDGGFRLE